MRLEDSSEGTSFESLEKELAKDALEVALKNLHKELIKDIELNKTTFSDQIQKTLYGFKKSLEKTPSEELDAKLSTLFKKHFKETSLEVKGSFEESFHPLLKTTQNEMNRLQSQGEDTLRSWKVMISQYESLWTRPFVLVFLASAFTGMCILIVCACFLWSTYGETIKGYETRLESNKKQLLWYFNKYKESPEYKEKERKSKSGPQQAQNKKKGMKE